MEVSSTSINVASMTAAAISHGFTCFATGAAVVSGAAAEAAAIDAETSSFEQTKARPRGRDGSGY